MYLYLIFCHVLSPELLNEIFDFLLDTYINFGFYLINEAEEEFLLKDITNEDSSSEKSILELLSRVIPLIVQSSFSDGLGHYNVEGIILNKIRELEKETGKNQYKIFILYFVLMDIDENNIKLYTDKVIDMAKMGVIKYSSLVKFNYYYTFNGGRSSSVADHLLKQIQKLQLKINPRTDKADMQRKLAKIKKQNLNKK